MYESLWPIRTYQPQFPAARFVGAGKLCRVEDVLVSGGTIHGQGFGRCGGRVLSSKLEQTLCDLLSIHE